MMSILKKTFTILILVSFIALTTIGLYLHFNGKRILMEKLTHILKRPVSVTSVSYQFPVGWTLKNFSIEGLLESPRVTGQVNLYDLFFKRQIYFSQIFFQRAKLYSKDPSFAPGISFVLEDLNIHLQELALPLAPVQTKFTFEGRLSKDQPYFAQSFVEGKGWINIIKRDMDGDLTVTEKNGQVGLRAHLVSENNLMKVKGNLQLTSVKTEAPKPVEPKATPTADEVVFGALSSMGVNIGAKFSFETKMDDFRVSNISFSGTVVK